MNWISLMSFDGGKTWGRQERLTNHQQSSFEGTDNKRWESIFSTDRLKVYKPTLPHIRMWRLVRIREDLIET